MLSFEAKPFTHSRGPLHRVELPGQEPGNPQGLGDLSLKGEIAAELCRIRVPDSRCTQVYRGMAGEFYRYTFPKPEISLHACLIIREMVSEISKEPVRFLVGDTDNRKSGPVCNPPGIYHVEPRDHAAREQDGIDVTAVKVLNHAKNHIGRVHAADRDPAGTKSIDAEVLSHHNAGQRGMFSPGITLRDPEYTQSLFGDMHRSTYDTRLKILYQ